LHYKIVYGIAHEILKGQRRFLLLGNGLQPLVSFSRQSHRKSFGFFAWHWCIYTLNVTACHQSFWIQTVGGSNFASARTCVASCPHNPTSQSVPRWSNKLLRAFSASVM